MEYAIQHVQVVIMEGVLIQHVNLVAWRIVPIAVSCNAQDVA